ncbi:rhodanese-related sulfurtransferase [Kineococcus xinjiangensis]|uniref:Rhodanese-related sulfurtransferase n=1 Tax=Kineococcus xinjiangensis TaxID=512762 RepID=A0A2S6IIX3_9ACTN|nr:rhodanese-like domain-containing protein [Kineococcus xinjiangensis]PPK94148.1 rhodanese-related sulfurtransferase [Kineococcus xinjiangensis]
MSYAGDLTPEAAYELLRSEPGAVLVDVRSEPEWQFVGVPDVSDLGKEPLFVPWRGGGPDPAGTFVAELSAAGLAPGDDVAVVLLCRSGVRSVAAAEALAAAGAHRAFNVLDGFEGALDEHGHRGGAGWRAAGLPWRQS